MEHPDRKLIVVDTLCAAVGEAMLVREAARKQQEGLTIEELAAWVEENRLKICHWFTVDSFDHLKHGGRVSAAAAAVGTMLQIKPLLHVDEEGKLRVAEKPRGCKQAIRTQVAHMKEGWTPEMGKLVVIGHGDCRTTWSSCVRPCSKSSPTLTSAWRISARSSARTPVPACWR